MELLVAGSYNSIHEERGIANWLVHLGVSDQVSDSPVRLADGRSL